MQINFVVNGQYLMFCTYFLATDRPVPFVIWIHLCQVCGMLFKALLYIHYVQLNLMFLGFQ